MNIRTKLVSGARGFAALALRPAVLLSVGGILLLSGGVTAWALHPEAAKTAPVSATKTAKPDSKAAPQPAQQGEVAAVSTTAPAAEGASAPASPVKSTARPSAKPQPVRPPYAGPVWKQLVLSKSTVVLSATTQWVSVEVTAADGQAIFAPVAKTPVPGVNIRTSDFNPPPNFPGGNAVQTKWYLYLDRKDFTGSGETQVDIETIALRYRASLRVILEPTPTFTTIQGGLTQTEDATTITFTMHYTIVPRGNLSGVEIVAGAGTYGQCLNGPPGLRYYNYSGANAQTFVCTLAKLPHGQQGGGMPLTLTVFNHTSRNVMNYQLPVY